MLLGLPVVRPSFQSFLQTGCQRVLEIFLVDTSGKSSEKNALKHFLDHKTFSICQTESKRQLGNWK